MDLDGYQAKAAYYDLFSLNSDPKTVNFNEKILGLTGEAGEVADKFKKILRDKNGKIDEVNKFEIQKELGDTLWYLASIARYLNIPLSEVAKSNLDKLENRKQRNQLHGSGDNR